MVAEKIQKEHKLLWFYINYFFLNLTRLLQGFLLFSLSLMIVPLQPFFQKRSWKRLGIKARQLGLVHNQSESKSEFGVLHSKMRGHNVIVKPDNGGMILALFHTVKQITVEDRRHLQCSDDQVAFKTNNCEFDKAFKTRQASAEVASLLQRDSSMLEQIVQFYNKWVWHLKIFSINEDGVTCILHHDPFYPSMSAFVLGQIVPDMANLVKQLEKTLNSSGVSVDPSWYLD